MIVDNTFQSMLRQVKDDLLPFPGRLATAWRIGLLSALMCFVAMFYGIPESAISCYLILFVMKPDAVISMIMGVAILIMVTLVVGIILLILPYTLESVPLRMAVLIISSFFFLWLGSVSQLGEVGSIIALVIAFIMGLIGIAPNGEVATRAILYAWLMVASPMLLLIVFNLLIGRSPVKILYANLAERLRLAETALREPDAIHLRRVQIALAEGQADNEKRAMLVRVFHLGKGSENTWLASAVNNSYRLLVAVSEQAEIMPYDRRLELAEACRDMAHVLGNRLQPVFSFPDIGDSDNEIEIALTELASPVDGTLPSLQKSPFFSDDALTNPVHCYFALKTTLASVICYMAYTLMDWQDIHTAMITCYVAVLGTTGETVHKLTLRIVGCLIGAGLGIASLIFMVPDMSDIGQLMVLVFFVLLLSAWVSGGHERISYGGIQIGLAFLLTVLHGFSPSNDLTPATGRIMGILMGNLTIYVIFSLIWPASISDAVHKRIRLTLQDLVTLAVMPRKDRMLRAMQVARIEQGVNIARNSLRFMPFEPKHLRPSTAEFQHLEKILVSLEETGRALFISQQDNSEERLRLQALYLSTQQPVYDPGGGHSTLQYKQEISGSYATSRASGSSGTDPRVERNLLRLEGLLR
ncbi:FUSC family protein [Escherichia coli]|uniref:FUSC family protein n=1 Tax=Escherichia coli TaxID=562 RepID=UPI0038B53988